MMYTLNEDLNPVSSIEVCVELRISDQIGPGVSVTYSLIYVETPDTSQGEKPVTHHLVFIDP